MNLPKVLRHAHFGKTLGRRITLLCVPLRICNCCEKIEFYKASLLFFHLSWAPPCMWIGRLRWKTARVVSICHFSNKFRYSAQFVRNASIIVRRSGLLKFRGHTNISAKSCTKGGFSLVMGSKWSSLIAQSSVSQLNRPTSGHHFKWRLATAVPQLPCNPSTWICSDVIVPWKQCVRS